MANKFKKPEPVEKETLEAALKDTDSFISFQRAFQGLGIKLEKPGQKTPESDGVPRIFLIKGDDPNDPFSRTAKRHPCLSPVAGRWPRRFWRGVQGAHPRHKRLCGHQAPPEVNLRRSVSP